MAEIDEDLVDSINQKNINQRASALTEDPVDPMRGTLRGFFGNLTGERQESVAAARAALEAEQNRKMQVQSMRDETIARTLQEKRFEQEYPDLDVNIGGEKYNIRQLAQSNPDLAKKLGSFAMTRAEKKAQVEMMKADADERAAMARIASAQRKIEEEQRKTSKQFGPFSFGGPSQKTIEEQQQNIQTESETYGIPLGSEPEGLEPAPEAKTGAASTWLRSKLK